MKTTKALFAILTIASALVAQAQGQTTNLVATLVMQFSSAQNLTTPVLPIGGSYFFLVTGRYGVGPGDRGEAMQDAAWATVITSTLDAYHVPNYGWQWNGTSTNRPTPDVYQTNHVYRFDFIGRGAAEVLTFTDSVYWDNVGTLTFELYETVSPQTLVTTYFSTTNAEMWQIAGGGAANATPYRLSNGGDLSIISGGDSGSYVAGVTNFTGFWLAEYRFYLPQGATHIALTYTNLYVDDRGLLLLNGNPIVATGIPYFGNLNPGSLVLTDGGLPEAYASFVGPDGSVSGTVTNGFNIGGFNTLRVIVNNTHAGVVGSNIPVSSGDATSLSLSGTVSYLTQTQGFLTNGLVAHYPFNGNAEDASGNGNNGTAANVTFETVGNRLAAKFTGALNSSVTVPNSPSLSMTNAVTVSLWFDVFGSLNGPQCILDKAWKPPVYHDWTYRSWSTWFSDIVSFGGSTNGAPIGGPNDGVGVGPVDYNKWYCSASVENAGFGVELTH